MHSPIKQLLKENGYRLRDIERGIREQERLMTYAEQGDMASVDLIIDSQAVINNCGATDKQIDTAYLYYREGLKLYEIGNRLNVTPQAVAFNLKLLKVRIKQVLSEQNQIVIDEHNYVEDTEDTSLNTRKIFINEEDKR